MCRSDIPVLFQMFRPNAGSFFHGFDARAFLVIGFRAGFGSGVVVFFPSQPQEFGAGEGAHAAGEFLRQLLHYPVVCLFALSVGAVGASVFQSGEQEYPACRPTGEPHASDASAEGGGHPQCLLGGVSVEVGEGGADRLRTVITCLEQFYRFLNAFFHISLI